MFPSIFPTPYFLLYVFHFVFCTLMIDNVNFIGCSKVLVDLHGKVLLLGSVKTMSFT